jgi:hypothetical protein
MSQLKAAAPKAGASCLISRTVLSKSILVTKYIFPTIISGMYALWIVPGTRMSRVAQINAMPLFPVKRDTKAYPKSEVKAARKKK